MPKHIPILLQREYEKDGISVAVAIKLRSLKTDEIVGFTSCDATLRIKDDDGVIRYDPTEELTPQNLQFSADMTVDNTNLVGWFSEALEKKILAGVFESAEITIYRVAYLNLAAGYEILGYGNVGEISYSSDKKQRRKVEFRGLTQNLAQITNKFYSLTCRAAFGDEDCRMPFVWEEAAVVELGSNAQLKFKVGGISRPTDYFLLGVVNFVDGDNAGADLEIESWDADGSVKLSYVTPYPVAVGTKVRIRRDCGKTETDCIDYGNIVNMQAEHLTPSEDQALMVPGAYIKNRNAL